MFRNEILRWVGPYFIARSAFRSTELRRTALYVLIGLLGIIGVFALLEARLAPYLYLHVLQSLGMGNTLHPMAYGRFGLFRVSGTVEHPIYFGNMCLVVLGMVLVLAKTSGMSLKNPWVVAGLISALGCIGVSISFTPYVGVLGGSAILAALVFVPWTRKLIIPLTLAVIVGMFAFTYSVAHQPLGEKKDGDLNGSYYTRKLIIVESWRKAAGAGAFGYGPNLESDEYFDLASVDNSYMLYTMTRGYVYTTLWVMIAVVFAVRCTRGFMHVTHPSQVFPLAAGAATIFALMLSMYTVWAGGIYAVVWAVMLGLCNTVIDLVIYPELLTDTAPRRRPRLMVLMAAATAPAPRRMPALRAAQAAGSNGRR